MYVKGYANLSYSIQKVYIIGYVQKNYSRKLTIARFSPLFKAELMTTMARKVSKKRKIGVTVNRTMNGYAVNNVFSKNVD